MTLYIFSSCSPFQLFPLTVLPFDFCNFEVVGTPTLKQGSM